MRVRISLAALLHEGKKIMPNYCDQDLWITGPTEELKKFKAFAKEDIEHFNIFNGTYFLQEFLLSANKFIPYPQGYRDQDKFSIEQSKKGIYVPDGFNSGGYEWCVNNWGTKWGICDCVLSREKLGKKDGKLFYKFHSAWSPCNKIISAMAERFPELLFKLKYYEMGCGYKGIFVIKGWTIILDEKSKYHGKRGG